VALKAETELRKMLELLEIPVKANYQPKEVQLILGISDNTFLRMVKSYEPDFKTGKPRKPRTLDSFIIGRSHRVSFFELVDYLARNNAYERACK